MVFLFKKLAYASTLEEYNDILTAAISEGGAKMKAFMDNLPAESFSKAHFKGNRYGEMTSNASESFNAQIKRFKHLPVTEMIDQIRKMMMEQIYNRRIEGSRWNSTLCPSIMLKYNRRAEEGRSWAVIPSSQNLFEVLSLPFSCIVDISDVSCTCGDWQHEGFPCAHAIAVLQKGQEDHFNHIDRFFFVETYRKCYSYSIPPIDRTDVPLLAHQEPLILPPLVKRPPGRPKNKRIPSQGENMKKKKKCSRCGKLGYHNSRTCKEAI